MTVPSGTFYFNGCISKEMLLVCVAPDEAGESAQQTRTYSQTADHHNRRSSVEMAELKHSENP